MRGKIAKMVALLLLGIASTVATADAQRSTYRPVQIDTIYGSSSIEVDEVDNYRVRISAGAKWPIQYYWDMGDGTLSIGNNIVHKFKRPGNFRVRVWARNSSSVDSTEMIVRVTDQTIPPAETPVVAARSVTSNNKVQKPRPTRVAAREQEDLGDIEEGQAFAWVIGTHLEKASAERALQKLRADKIAGVRILEDRSGKGVRAYRVTIGNYLSLDSAVRSKPAIEKIVDKKVWLFAFSR